MLWGVNSKQEIFGHIYIHLHVAPSEAILTTLHRGKDKDGHDTLMLLCIPWRIITVSPHNLNTFNVAAFEMYFAHSIVDGGKRVVPQHDRGAQLEGIHSRT